MARAAKADLQKAKEAKQKKIAIVGFVILLAVAGFQVPRTMKLLKGADEAAAVSTPPATSTPATPTSTPAEGGLALPPVATGGTAGSTPAPSGDAASGSGPAPVAGQLVSFTRFASKDPFVQQIDPNATSEGSAPAGGKGAGSKGAGTKGGSGAGPGGGGEKPVLPSTATISVNGVSESVAVGGSFPASSPLFQLVKVGSSSVEIGIAGGSYASGEKTSTLRKGGTLVLQNTADGTRFEIRLVAVK